MKITKRKILEINAALDRLGAQKVGVKFAYGLAKNRKLIEAEVAALKEASKPTPEFLEFEAKRQKLCERYAVKKENGAPMTVDYGGGSGIYIIEPIKQKEFDRELDALKTENEEVIDDQEKRNKQVEEILKDEVDIEFCKMKLDAFPEEMEVAVISLLYPLIEE